MVENTLSENNLKQLMARGNVLYYCQLTCESIGPENSLNNSEEVNKILGHFDYLFADPTSMPPKRKRNHRIVLNPHTAPINIHPYCYPQFQKNKIEKLTREMLYQGLIRPSSSPFSSLVLLVRKKDRSWRFCVDYSALNATTICYRFPIPTMDELIDELHGSVVFSKLDLRARYH